MTVRCLPELVSGATEAVKAESLQNYLRSGDRGGGNFIRQCLRIMTTELEKSVTYIILVKHLHIFKTQKRKMHLNVLIAPDERKVVKVCKNLSRNSPGIFHVCSSQLGSPGSHAPATSPVMLTLEE